MYLHITKSLPIADYWKIKCIPQDRWQFVKVSQHDVPTSRYCLSSCGDCGNDQSTAGLAPQPQAAAAAATRAFLAIAAPRWDLYSTMAAHEAIERRMRTSCTSSVSAYNRRTISADGVVGGMRDMKIRQLLMEGHTPKKK